MLAIALAFVAGNLVHEYSERGRTAELEILIGEAPIGVKRDRLLNERQKAPPFRTPLIAAASLRRPAVVRTLLDHGANVDLADADGRTALMHAASVGLAESVAMLLGAGAQINATDKNQEGALHRAAERGHAAVVRLLLDSGAPANAVSHGCVTALWLALNGCHGTAATALIGAGAHGARPRPPPWAAVDGPPPVRACPAAAAVPDIASAAPAPAARSWRCGKPASPIDLPAAQLGQLHAQLQAQLHAEHERPEPLPPAIGPPSEAQLRVILTDAALGLPAVGPLTLAQHSAAEAKRAAAAAAAPMAPAHRELARTVADSYAASQAFFAAHPSPTPGSQTDTSRFNSLQLAASQGDSPAVRKLLTAHGADVDALGYDRLTALHLAAVGGHASVVKLLLNAGAVRCPPSSPPPSLPPSSPSSSPFPLPRRARGWRRPPRGTPPSTSPRLEASSPPPPSYLPSTLPSPRSWLSRPTEAPPRR